jgi:hypothetical protein
LLRRSAFRSAVRGVHVQLRDSRIADIAGASNCRLGGVEYFSECGIATRLRLAVFRTRSDLNIFVGRHNSEASKLESGV